MGNQAPHFQQQVTGGLNEPRVTAVPRVSGETRVPSGLVEPRVTAVPSFPAENRVPRVSGETRVPSGGVTPRVTAVPQAPPPRTDVQHDPLYPYFKELLHLPYTPYQILGLIEGVEYDEASIKSAYRPIAIKYHPDKGGNPTVFKYITMAYQYLLKRSQATRSAYVSHADLKAQYEQSMPVTQPPQVKETTHTAPPPEDDSYFSKTETFSSTKFNQFFERNRMSDEAVDGGYGDWRTTDTREEPIQNPTLGRDASSDVFHREFSNYKRNQNQTKQVVQYVEPQPLSVSNRLAHSEIDYRKQSDYSKEYDIQDGSSRNGIYYMDYKRAYTETTLIDPSTVQDRKTYRSVDEYNKHRDVEGQRGLTAEERAYYEEKERMEAERERERLQRVTSRDQYIVQHATGLQNRLR